MTSDMMFYVKAAASEEERIRRDGLAQLRRKVHEKMQKYQRPKEWEGSHWLGYDG